MLQWFETRRLFQSLGIYSAAVLSHDCSSSYGVLIGFQILIKDNGFGSAGSGNIRNSRANNTLYLSLWRQNNNLWRHSFPLSLHVLRSSAKPGGRNLSHLLFDPIVTNRSGFAVLARCRRMLVPRRPVKSTSMQQKSSITMRRYSPRSIGIRLIF